MAIYYTVNMMKDCFVVQTEAGPNTTDPFTVMSFIHSTVLTCIFYNIFTRNYFENLI